VYRYTEIAIGAVLDKLPVAAEVRWAHDQGNRLVAMQRLAHSSGLAYLTESHLNVHPEFGPWIALRAVLMLSAPAPDSPPSDLSHPCGSCVGKCLPAFKRAIQAIGGDLSSQAVEARWKDWRAIRDACPTGREHRYSEPQILYHYTKDWTILA
jgi:methylmalonic aciduria homocystinuria type C protein